jgi:2-oxo-3-hexenedioate decarboxylase
MTNLADELLAAYTSGGTVTVPPSARDENFDLKAAYAVEAELTRLRIESGRKTVGLKVGYANKAVWRALKLESLVWAHMYDDTVHYSEGTSAELTLPYYRAPKIEPEIVFKLKEPMASAGLDAAAVLQHMDWLALGFEIIDCPFPNWQLKPADFVAAFGVHLALVVGPPLKVEPAMVEALAQFKVRLLKDGQFVEEGSGKNSLRSPALCVAELAGRTPLSAGDLISTGTLTAGQSIGKGDVWKAEIDGLPLLNLTLRFH